MTDGEVLMKLKYGRDFLTYFETQEMHKYLLKNHAKFYKTINSNLDQITEIKTIINYLEGKQDE